ncbi:MAG: PspC domain-containing protein [Clostridia bacterium]|nr:PspC domain-containing protein [Clostridia bacterium]
MKKLYKSNNDRKLCGVCGGVAEYLNVDSTIIRLAWGALILFAGTGILAYILAALIIPDDNGYIQQ